MLLSLSPPPSPIYNTTSIQQLPLGGLELLPRPQIKAQLGKKKDEMPPPIATDGSMMQLNLVTTFFLFASALQSLMCLFSQQEKLIGLLEKYQFLLSWVFGIFCLLR